MNGARDHRPRADRSPFAPEDVLAELGIDQAAARTELARVLDERYEIGLATIDDPDLVDQ